MRILTLQSAILVSLAVAGVTMGACSSSDAPNRGGDAGAPASGGSGNAAGETPGGGSGNVGNTGNTGGATPGAGAGGASAGAPATGGSGGAAAPSVCDGVATRVFTVEDNAFIDDFECVTGTCDPTTMVAYGWSTFNDLGAPGVDAADNMIKMLQVPDGKTGKGGQYTGTGANPSKVAPGFGVGAIFNVVIDPAGGYLCADVTALDGLSFWAKAGTAGAKIDVNFVIPATNAAGVDDMARPNGGDCKTGCFNHPKKSLTLTADWQPYTVTFAEAAGGSAKVKGLIQEIGFLSADAAWDFSLDEIAFYKGTAPVPPIAPPAP